MLFWRKRGKMLWNLFQSKIRCLFKHILLVNWNIENMYSNEDDIFLRKSKSEGETIGNSADAVLNDFHGLESKKYLNNVWRNISLDSSDDAIVILQDMRCPGMCSRCKQESNINHSCWFNSASLYRVLYLGINLYFLSWKLLFE